MTRTEAKRTRTERIAANEVAVLEAKAEAGRLEAALKSAYGMLYAAEQVGRRLKAEADAERIPDDLAARIVAADLDLSRLVADHATLKRRGLIDIERWTGKATWHYTAPLVLDSLREWAEVKS